jgi:hypothetical protein
MIKERWIEGIIQIVRGVQKGVKWKDAEGASGRKEKDKNQNMVDVHYYQSDLSLFPHTHLSQCLKIPINISAMSQFSSSCN